MTDQTTQRSTGESFDNMISIDDPSSISTTTVPKENYGSDDDSDQFSESKCMSRSDFCISIRNAQNGGDIFHLVNNNLQRGKVGIY